MNGIAGHALKGPQRQGLQIAPNNLMNAWAGRGDLLIFPISIRDAVPSNCTT
jgi:hypothetical protein